MRDFEEIRFLAVELQKLRSPIIQKMLEISTYYNADWVIPLPDVRDEPNMPLLSPSLMTDVIDNLALRAASVRPMIHSPAKDQYGPESVRYASDRVRIINYTLHQSGWTLARRRKLRHQNAYETEAMVVEPDFKFGAPKVRIRNPLEAFPEQRSQDSMEPPEYVAFITRYSGSYLRARFPQIREEKGGPISPVSEAEMWDVVEWHDSEQIMYGLLGPIHYEGDHISSEYVERFGGPWMPLTDPVPNRAGRCLALVPSGVTLHRIGNRLNRLIGMIEWQNKLMALDVIAQEKAVFPDLYAVSSQSGRQPTLVDGEWKDGRTGEINLIEGADRVGFLNGASDPRTAQLSDRIEQSFRMSSGLAPQMQGVTHGAALRTGRALGQMAEISIDPRIQELHEIDETWMPFLNERILACYEGWWPSKRYTVFSGWPGDTGTLEFSPNECIEGIYDTSVEYAISGADITQVTMAVGSLLGAELISAETGQRLHPMIRNPEDEQKKIEQEKLDKIALEGLAQQVMSGQLPMAVFARVKKLYETTEDLSLTDAIVQVDEDIREEQLAAQQAAAAAQPPLPEELGINAVPGLAAGPASAAPGLPPGLPVGPGMPPALPPGPPQSPMARMQGLLAGANPLGG